MKYLVGVDESDAAKTAVENTIRLSRPELDQIDLVHFALPVTAAVQQDEMARALVARLESSVTSAGIMVSGAVAHGDPRTGLLEAAANRHADCIVVGARGIGMIQSALFGSVSSSILHTAEHPVMVVKSPFPPTPHRRFLYCHDGLNPTSKSAFELLLLLAKPGDTVFCVSVLQKLEVTFKIQLLTGCDPNMAETLDEINESNAIRVQAQLEACVQECIKHKLEATSVFKIGDPKSILLDVCAKNAIEVVVLGSRDLSSVQRFVLGSVSNSLVHQSDCNAVVVVKGSLRV